MGGWPLAPGYGAVSARVQSAGGAAVAAPAVAYVRLGGSLSVALAGALGLALAPADVGGADSKSTAHGVQLHQSYIQLSQLKPVEAEEAKA